MLDGLLISRRVDYLGAKASTRKDRRYVHSYTRGASGSRGSHK
jgi:hypothetical protein